MCIFRTADSYESSSLHTITAWCNRGAGTCIQYHTSCTILQFMTMCVHLQCRGMKTCRLLLVTVHFDKDRLTTNYKVSVYENKNLKWKLKSTRFQTSIHQCLSPNIMKNRKRGTPKMLLNSTPVVDNAMQFGRVEHWTRVYTKQRQWLNAPWIWFQKLTITPT